MRAGSYEPFKFIHKLLEPPSDAKSRPRQGGYFSVHAPICRVGFVQAEVDALQLVDMLNHLQELCAPLAEAVSEVADFDEHVNGRFLSCGLWSCLSNSMKGYGRSSLGRSLWRGSQACGCPERDLESLRKTPLGPLESSRQIRRRMMKGEILLQRVSVLKIENFLEKVGIQLPDELHEPVAFKIS